VSSYQKRYVIELWLSIGYTSKATVVEKKKKTDLDFQWQHLLKAIQSLTHANRLAWLEEYADNSVTRQVLWMNNLKQLE